MHRLYHFTNYYEMDGNDLSGLGGGKGFKGKRNNMEDMCIQSKTWREKGDGRKGQKERERKIRK